VKRSPRQKDEAHLKFIRGLPCCVCGNNIETEAAHVRMPDPTIAKPLTGLGIKPDDKFTVPLCGDHHRTQHANKEAVFWSRWGRNCDPVKLALALYAVSGDHELGERIALANVGEPR
jgi:hypothetical protein